VQTDIMLTTSKGVRFPGVLTVPEDDQAPGPALVMIYEAFGMTDEMRRVARDLAAEGFVVLIPDLFARRGPRALCVASAMRTAARGDGEELRDIEMARRWLAAHPAVDPERIGAIGFCLGGSFALLLARSGMYKVSAPFYSSLAVDMPRSCPVVASYGGRDLTARGNAEKLTAQLKALGVQHDVVTYPEAGHSFFTHTDGFMGRLGPYTPLRAEYHEASARDAHRRIVAFFREHLAPAAG
jgi:carboxymethylenebutenolidase